MKEQLRVTKTVPNRLADRFPKISPESYSTKIEVRHGSSGDVIITVFWQSIYKKKSFLPLFFGLGQTTAFHLFMSMEENLPARRGSRQIGYWH